MRTNLKKRQRGREFWEVSIRDKELVSDKTYYVFASCAAEAENRALKLALQDTGTFSKPYCYSADFGGYVY